MSVLPFPVVHGWWMSHVILWGSAAVGVGLVAAFSKWLGRARARARVQQLGHEVADSPSPGIVKLRGVLRGGSITTVDQQLHTRSTTAKTGEPWIDCNGERADLDADVVVRIGTWTRVSWWLPKGAPQPDESLPGVKHLHTLNEGDEVIVVGALAEHRDVDDNGSSSAQRRLVFSGEAPVELFSRRPARYVLTFGPWVVVWAALFAVSGYYGYRAIGHWLIAKGESRESWKRPLPKSISSNSTVAWAAALPGTRDKALDELYHQVHYSLGNTEAALQQRLAMNELFDGCAGRMRQLVREGRAEEALSLDAKCKDDSAAMYAYLFLGRYEDAARIATPTNASFHQRILATIGTGRWADAVAVADEFVLSAARPPNALADDQLVGLRCYADLLRFFASEPGAAARVADIAGRSRHLTCLVAQALVAGEEHRLVRLAEAYKEISKSDRVKARVVAQIAWAYGARFAPDLNEPQAALLHPYWRDVDEWLAPHALAASNGGSAAWAWMPVVDVYRGDFDAARRRLSELTLRLQEEPTRDPSAVAEGVEGMSLALQLREGTRELQRSSSSSTVSFVVEDAVDLRRGKVVEGERKGLSLGNKGCFPHEALVAAARGDGAPLADVIESCRVRWHSASNILAVAPRVTRDRERLAATLRMFRGDPLDGGIGVLGGFVRDLAMSRDLARAVGDTPTVESHQLIIDRHLAAFLARERVVALLLWNES